MGRSNLKYRTSRGRGAARAESTRNKERGLASNAFRYAVNDEDDADLHATTAEPSRKQFFEEERNYRDRIVTEGSYFQSKAVSEGRLQDDIEERSGIVGVLDCEWLATQLARVPLVQRYNIDPSFFRSASEVAEKAASDTAATEGNKEDDLQRVSDRASESALDDLLKLSVSQVEGQTAASVTATVAAVPNPDTPSDSPEQLETWLDDILDM
ncbi:hypothetical protein PINS_up004931 [Pythium insidiosum]|nr:hypothetical protein PINS_up004931 [Pythium insidiosum]